MRIVSLAVAAVAVVVAPLALVPSVATATDGAAPAAPVTWSKSEWKAAGFGVKPKVPLPESGLSATLSAKSAQPFENVTLSGTWKYWSGQTVRLYRVIPQSDGSLKANPLNITTKVKKNGTFSLLMELGVQGRWGYAVSNRAFCDPTRNDCPQVQFQLRTTNYSPTPTPSTTWTPAQWTSAGFTTTATWTLPGGNPATLSRTTAKRFQDITLKGTESYWAGQTIRLYRMVPQSDGTLTPTPLSVTTKVASSGSFSLLMELGQPGTWGYSVNNGDCTVDPRTNDCPQYLFQLTTTS